MPRRTIWVRDDDVDAFDAIQDRPSWLHNAIKHRGPLEQGMDIATLIPSETFKNAGPLMSPLERHPTQVNPKSHGPEIEQPHYEPIDDLP